MNGQNNIKYDSFLESQKEQIRQGYGAVYRDLGTGKDICSFNMETFKPPKQNMKRLAKSLVSACKEFYSDPQNVKKFEEWKKRNEGDETKKNS